MIVICDYCKRQFEVVMKEEAKAGTIIETYFTCDNCGHKYHAFYRNAKCRRLLRDKDWIAYRKEYKRINPKSDIEV